MQCDVVIKCLMTPNVVSGCYMPNLEFLDDKKLVNSEKPFFLQSNSS